MYSSLKDSIFYIVIVGNDETDHLYLRKVMNKLLPQAIVESLYGNSEAVSYFEKHNAVPSVIFLDQHLMTINGCAIMPLIRSNEDMDQVPVIILGSQSDNFSREDTLRSGAN